ncbi:MAG: UPF0149 family protein [Gammaproteobacteria bacterium]|nr:UPF0149 family protein [Gammaproteobacteria bacterium]
MVVHELNKDEKQMLLDFFPVDVSNDRKLTINRLKGYLTSLALSPVEISSEKWWDAIKVLPEIKIDSEGQEIELCKVLIKIDDKIKEFIKEAINQVPDYQDFSTQAFGSTAVEQWCLGFMDGVLVCEEAWFNIEDNDAIENLELAFGVVSLVADREQIKKEMKESDYDKKIDEAQKFLPQVMLKLDEMRNSSLYRNRV